MKTSEQIRSDFLLNKGSYKRFVSMVIQFPIIELPEYSSQLYARLSEARLVMPAKVSLGTWEPEHNECHSNVSTWCKNMPKYKTVRGWLYFDLENILPFVLFNAHSVIRDSKGELWDITPSEASQLYPFIIAEESEEEFSTLIKSGVSRLRHFI